MCFLLIKNLHIFTKQSLLLSCPQDHISTFLWIYDKGVTSERLSDLLANVMKPTMVRTTVTMAVTMAAWLPSLTPGQLCCGYCSLNCSWHMNTYLHSTWRKVPSFPFCRWDNHPEDHTASKWNTTRTWAPLMAGLELYQLSHAIPSLQLTHLFSRSSDQQYNKQLMICPHLNGDIWRID